MEIPLVKVCCIASPDEAIVALDAGADFLGLVSEMPSGPGVIPLDDIARIVDRLPAETRTILLTSKRSFSDISTQHKQVKTWGLQLVDSLPENELKQLRKALPETCLIQVIHVKDDSSISEALRYEGLVDYLLLDSGNPDAMIKTLGGTGKTHDWEISREICAKSVLPVLLAGGLNPSNICAAKTAVNPAGFDLCSGIRRDGNLDPKKLKSFLTLVHQDERISG